MIGNQQVVTDLVGLEANMDVEMMHLAAPDAQINFYSAYSPYDGDLARAISQAVNDDVVALSGSWTLCERDLAATTLNGYHSLFQQAAVRGTAVVFSSGDSGIYECTPAGVNTVAGFSAYPAGDDLVTAIGGTSLSRNSQSGAWAGETAWSCPTGRADDGGCWQNNGGSSGGGKTVNIPRPAYQSAITPPVEPKFTNTATNTRVQPDLSMNADPASGVLVFYQGAGVSNDYYSGGTSASAPLLAGTLALAAQQGGGKLGGINPFIYANYNGAAWRSDVISGYNGVTAKAGWDFTTGLGSVKDVKAFVDAFDGAAARPYLRFDSLTISDAGPGNNHNNLIDPGETVSLQLRLKNIGAAQASPVTANLSLLGANSNVSLPVSDVTYPAIGSGLSVTGGAFTLKLSLTEPCNDVLKLRLLVNYNNGYSYTYDFSVALGSSSLGSSVSYSYAGSPQAIPDAPASGLVSSLNVSTAARVGSLRVHVNITHPYVSDLVLTLISPAGTSVKLAASRGGAGQNFNGTIFDDSATYFIGDQAHATPPFSGSFQPEDPLASLKNEVAGGTWQLLATDVGEGLTGTLNSWSLDLIPATFSCAPVPSPVPTLTALVPATVQLNNPTFVLGVSGTNFVPTSSVVLNGNARPTVYVNSQQLLVTINPTDINTVGLLPLMVVNPAPGGGTTAPQSLTVTSACPDLTVTVSGGLGCGTLANALAKVGPGGLIGFALPLNPANPVTISLSGQITLPTGATLAAPCTLGGPAIILQASTGVALRPGAGNFINGLWFKSAGGPTLAVTGGNSHFSCVKISK